MNGDSEDKLAPSIHVNEGGYAINHKNCNYAWPFHLLAQCIVVAYYPQAYPNCKLGMGLGMRLGMYKLNDLYAVIIFVICNMHADIDWGTVPILKKSK